MHTNLKKLKLTVFSLLISFSAAHNSHAKVDLSVDCEQALALSALPTRLRDQASVYILNEKGFEKTRTSEGPFSCIVARNHPQSIIPQCVDAAGRDTILPAIIFRTEQSLNGKQPDQIAKQFESMAEDGTFVAPARPGLSYMMSPFNKIYSHKTNDFIAAGPHVMYYAPNLSNEDIGGSFEAATQHNRGVPFMIEQGIHAYMVSFVEHASDKADVINSCKGQLDEAAGESKS